MTDPDEFPAKGTWTVIYWPRRSQHFIIEAHGDGNGHIVELDLEDGLLERICARHNEGIREER